MPSLRISAVALFAFLLSVSGFSAPIFQKVAKMQKTAPSKQEGVEIELPDFDELFHRIRQVSPLAQVAMEKDGGTDNKRGFEAFDIVEPCTLKWKTMESNKRRLVHHIDKIDNFQNLGSPIIRYRSSLNGPCVGDRFANLIMCLEERKKWDDQIAYVEETHPINDLDAANIMMGFGKFGDCSRLGLGYTQTRANLGIPPREQLTLCGIQDFPDGSCLIWGTEMEEWHDHLLPPGERHTRAKSHLFSTTLVPTSDNTFDVEYVLQMDCGGGLPVWLTTPKLVATVKNMFNRASKYFGEGEGGELDRYLKEQAAKQKAFGHSILMTP